MPRTLVCLVLASLVGATAPALAQRPSQGTDAAQPDAATRARGLFAEGVSHTQAERWNEAVEAFRAALALREAPPIHYNLAAALVELGRHRDALEHVEAVLASADAAPGIRELAQALEARIGRESGLLRIEADPSSDDAVLTLDEEELTPRWRSRPVPVAPGTHHVALLRDGRVIAETEASVEAGETTRVRLALVDTLPGTAVPLEEDWRFWLGIGAGATLLVTVIAIVAATASGEAPPVVGNFMPGAITW